MVRVYWGKGFTRPGHAEEYPYAWGLGDWCNKDCSHLEKEISDGEVYMHSMNSFEYHALCGRCARKLGFIW